MIEIVNFLPKHFEGMAECYRAGFPDGHNRYALSRLARFQSETIILAVHEQQKVVGVIIGITSHREAWLTALTVLPRAEARCYLELLDALGHRLYDLGFRQAYATTHRPSILKLAWRVGVQDLTYEKNFYFDGSDRYILTLDVQNLYALHRLLERK